MKLKQVLQSCIDSDIKATAMGYIAHLDYIEKKSKRYTQHKCDRCGKYHIWKKKLAKAAEEGLLK